MNTQPIAHGLNRGLWVSSQRLAFSNDEARHFTEHRYRTIVSCGKIKKEVEYK